jgi:multicomponent Na+:H+ antiporter subunit B
VIWQLDLLLFVILVVVAVLALRVRDLMAGVAILAGFSLLVAVMFAGMAAVDVAFVEAVLGAGFTGLLFLVLIRATDSRSTEDDGGTRRWVLLPLIGAFVALMVYASADLPDRGDPEAPAHVHVSPTYIERAVPDARTPNVVTAVLADFRSLDTLGEVVVIFTAGTAAVLILRSNRPEDDDERAGGTGTHGEEGSR